MKQRKRSTMVGNKTLYTPTQLTAFLNECFGSKATGVPFTTADINMYIIRGHLPFKYGKYLLKVEKLTRGDKGQVVSIQDGGLLEKMRIEKQKLRNGREEED